MRLGGAAGAGPEHYDVALADGRQALDRIAGEEVDAVVLDIAMPHVRSAWSAGAAAAAPGGAPQP